MIRKGFHPPYRDLPKMIAGHIEQHRAALAQGRTGVRRCGISGVVVLSPILWLSNR